MAADVEDWELSCLTCQERKVPANRGSTPSGEMPQSSKPCEFIQDDLKDPETPAGNRYVLVVYDISSKYVVMQSLKDKGTKAVTITLMNHVVLEFRQPRCICSNHGRNLNLSYYMRFANNSR